MYSASQCVFLSLRCCGSECCCLLMARRGSLHVSRITARRIHHARLSAGLAGAGGRTGGRGWAAGTLSLPPGRLVLRPPPASLPLDCMCSSSQRWLRWRLDFHTEKSRLSDAIATCHGVEEALPLGAFASRTWKKESMIVGSKFYPCHT